MINLGPCDISFTEFFTRITQLRRLLYTKSVTKLVVKQVEGLLLKDLKILVAEWWWNSFLVLTNILIKEDLFKSKPYQLTNHFPANRLVSNDETRKKEAFFKIQIKITFSKGRLRATIFESAETVHLILLYYLGDAIWCAVSADSKMVARYRPLTFS